MVAARNATGAVAVTSALSLVLVLVACSGDDRPATGATSSSSASSSASSSGGRSSEGGSDGAASSSSSGDVGLDASPDDAASAPACADVAREGPDVAEVRIAEEPPPAAGGALVAGKYFLTTWETYAGAGAAAGPTGAVRRTTLIVTATELTFASRDVGEGDDLPVRIEILDPPQPAMPATLESVEACPLGGRPLTRHFTVSGAELVLFEPFGLFTRRLVFTRQ